QNHTPHEGKDAIRSALKELETNDYAFLVRGGASKGSTWMIFECPEQCKAFKERLSGNQKPSKEEKERHGDKPEVGLTDSRFNPTLSNKDSVPMKEYVQRKRPSLDELPEEETESTLKASESYRNK